MQDYSDGFWYTSTIISKLGDLTGTVEVTYRNYPASHNETFAWHDKDGDGTLDEDELSEYLLPRREDSEEGYVDEELRQLMSVLHHGPDRIDYEEDEEEAPPPGGAEARFDVTRLREVGSMVLGAFPMLRDLAEETHGGEL